MTPNRIKIHAKMIDMVLHPYTDHHKYVKYDAYITSSLVSKAVEQKELPGIIYPSPNFHQLPLSYKYENNSNDDDFIIEGCEMETNMGIVTTICSDKQILFNICAKFNRYNSEHIRFLEMVNKIYQDSAYQLNQVKNKVKMYYFNMRSPEATGFKYPLYQPRDDMTGEPIPGQDFSLYLKLIYRDTEQTVFTDVSGNVIPWHKLEGTDMKFIPLIYFKDIFIYNGRASFRFEMISAVVTSFHRRNSISKQIPTLTALQQDHLNLSATLTNELKILSCDRENINHYRNLQRGDSSYSYDSKYIVSHKTYKSSMLSNTRAVLQRHHHDYYPPIEYYKIPLFYNYGSDHDLNLKDFFFEGCEMETNSGIQSIINHDGATKHYIFTQFDSNNPIHTQWIASMRKIYDDCVDLLYSIKKKIKMYGFDKNYPEWTGFKFPLYYPRDNNTGEILKDKPPSMFLKLFGNGRRLNQEQTLFTDMHGNPVPWELLSNIQMKFIPLIHIKYIYVNNSRASIQMHLQSAIITSIKPNEPPMN